MERGRGLWKKALSLVLSLAMVLTLMPAQFAYAVEGEGSGDSGSAEDKLPETLMYFSFDEDITDGGKVRAEIVTTDDANVPECSKDVHKVGNGALRLNNTNGAVAANKGAYLKVPAGALATRDDEGNIVKDDEGNPVGKTNLTISYWSKIAPNTDGYGGWVYFTSENDVPGEQLKYTGVFDKSNALTVECFNGGRGGSGKGADIQATSKGFKPTTEWKHVMAVMEGTALRLYINGVKIHEEKIDSGIPNLANSTFNIGRAPWGSGEYYNGYIDELIIYDGALTDAQAEAIGKRTIVEDAIKNGLIEGPAGTDYNLGVNDTLKITPINTIPASVKRQFRYKSSDEAVATVDDEGVVTAVGAGTAVITPTLRYDGTDYNGKELNITVKTPEQMLTPVKIYTFEENGEGSLQGAKVITKGLEDYKGTVAYAPGKDGVGKAVHTKSTTYKKETQTVDGKEQEVTVVDQPGYGLELEKNLGSSYTVSTWIKPDNAKAFHSNGSILGLGYGDSKKENWMSVSGNYNSGEDGSKARVWGNLTKTGRFDSNAKEYELKTQTEFTAEEKQWMMLTITQLQNTVSFYVNGELVNVFEVKDEVMNGADQGINLGVNFWDLEFDGLYDDVNIYDTALHADQVRALYVKDADANAIGMLGENESYDYITEDLVLPKTFKGHTLTWTSDKQDKIAVNGEVGEVKGLDGSEVTLTAKTDKEVFNGSDSKSFTVRLAKPVAINYVDESNKTVKTETEYCKVGTKYTYEVKESIFSTADAAYKCDEEANTQEKLTVDVTAEGTQTITVSCKKLPVGSVDFSTVPKDTVYMIQGNDPFIPKTVKGTVSADDGQQQPPAEGGEGTEDVAIDVPILWDDYSKLTPGEHTINGSAAGFKCQVKLHIFECDEAVADMAANNNNKKTKFKNGYKGVIETEYDIEVTGALGDLSAVEYYDKGITDDAGANWWCATSTRFTGGKFIVNGGNGKGGSAADSGSKDYPENSTITHDGTSTYHVRTRLDTTDVLVTPGTEATEDTPATEETVVRNGSYRVWVYAPDGSVTEVTNPEEAMTFRAIKTGIIDKVGALKQGFKITNHKISWQSGYVKKSVEIYLGDAQTPEESTSEKLLPSSLLGEAAADAYKYTPHSSYQKDNVKYILNKEKSGWYQGTTKIENPAAEDVAVADATVTYKAYYESGITNFAGLEEALNAAKETYDAAEAAGIYTSASLQAWKTVIDDAEEVLATQGKENEATGDVVDKAIEDLEKLAEQELVLKNFEEMSGSMAAYYPLTKDAKDATDNGHDARVNGDIRFDRSTGASFPGSDKGLKNYMELPKDMTVTNNMTFSFWANAQASGGGNNVFSLGSGHTMSSSNHLTIRTNKGASLQVDTGKKGWSEVSGVSNITFAPAEWHLITCVVTETDLVFYVDGVKQKEGTMGVSLEEAFAAHPEEEHIYLGNGMYAWNKEGADDPDYKGNVKYLRIYNASLAAEQVKDIYDYEVDAQLDAAAADLADELLAEAGTGENVGKYTMMITDETIQIPVTGPQGETIRWAAEDEEGAESNMIVFDEEKGTAAVTLPATGTAKVVLKATIRLNKKNKVVTIDSTLRTLTAELKAARAALKELLEQAVELIEGDYTSASWASFVTIRDAARAAYNAAGDNMVAQKAALETAMKTDGTGTLVPRGDKTELYALITKAQNAMKRAEDEKDEYEESVWNKLAAEIEAAESMSDDVSQEDVDEQKDKLQEAYDAFKPKTYTKEQAEELAADAEKLLEGKNEFEYTAKVWKDMQDALAAVKALTAESTTEQTTTAYRNLKKAMAAFEPIVIDREALATLISDVERDMDRLNKEDYVPSAWTATLAALAEVKDLPENADEAAVKAAYGKLWTAFKNLKGSPYVAVTDIAINPGTLTLTIGGTAALTATVNPADATDSKPVWSTSNGNVAAVDQNGKVTAVGSGTADIIAAAGGKTAVCKVTVKSAEVKVTSIKLTADNKNIMAGKKTNVKAVVLPNNATNKALTFKSSNPKYAAVNNKGVVTTKKAGAGKKVTITATANDGSYKVSNKLTIKIFKYGVKKVSFKKKTMTVKAGKKVTLKPTITLTNKKAKKSQVNKTLSYKSSNTKWATVTSKGKVTTKKAGKGKTVKITVTSTDGTNKKATVKIKIKK